ncbi:hypothetical protein F5Y18DRAFT_408112 [Xylariaceae sp. FL1019]|nr:hypothetical protein F5Y18DRAFT_408112 [Xylariaceae sp. FL1019]
MSFSPGSLMSNAFRFDSPVSNTGGVSLSGVHPGIFRPPGSPSLSTSAYLPGAQADTATRGPTAKRKRPGPRESTPFSDWNSAVDTAYGTPSASVDYGSRLNGQDGRYVFGRIGSPLFGAAKKELAHIEDSVCSDVNYRRGLGSKRPHDDIDSPAWRPMSGVQQSPSSAGWSAFAINTIGGVVGKVWDFCTVGAFRGFYAGGGRGYNVSRETQLRSSYRSPEPVDTPLECDCTPLPGGFPELEEPIYYEQGTPESTPPPAAKRRQISDPRPNDEIRKNWVMVGETANTTRPSSPASRAPSRPPVQQPITPSLARHINKPVGRLSTPNFNRHPPSRASQATFSPAIDREPASRASFASSRSPVVTSPMPSRIPIPISRPQSPSTISTSHFSHQPSRIPSPSPYAKRGHRRTQSAMPAVDASQGKKIRRRESLQEVQKNSPRLDAEARSLASRRMKEEKATDNRINDFNVRLQDMIRQGQEALGTTFEVDMDDDDDDEMDPWEDE